MQKKNKFLSIFLCLALIMSIIPMGYISASAETRFSGGDGESVDTAYQISTEADLIALATAVNGGEDFDGKFFKQTADITVTGFEPIGREYYYDYYYFNGIYDGGNNEINGTIGNEDEYYQALFGFVGEDGTIKNIINNANVNGEKYVGCIAGKNYGTITNCYNTGDVKYTGGLVGGVVGFNHGTITNCYNTGEVKGKGDKVGGITGHNNGTITNCYNTGAVTGNENVGGVVGYNNSGTITNCYFNKDVFVSEDTAGKTTLEMSTPEFVDLLNGEGEKAFSYKDDEDNIYYPYLTSFGEDSAVISKEKVEYEITKGDNQEVEIGTEGTLSFTSEGEFDKFKALYLGDEILDENLVVETNYTAVSGSTKITLNADYVKALPLGKQTFTLEFVDGYSTVNLEVTAKPVVEDDKTDDTNKPVVDDNENPKTDANSNFAFISILALISLAGAYGVKKKLGK